jgi:hypothetical protein
MKYENTDCDVRPSIIDLCLVVIVPSEAVRRPAHYPVDPINRQQSANLRHSFLFNERQRGRKGWRWVPMPGSIVHRRCMHLQTVRPGPQWRNDLRVLRYHLGRRRACWCVCFDGTQRLNTFSYTQETRQRVRYTRLRTIGHR